jgi:DNA-binding CsgD family transcriptional regulator
MKKVDDFFIPKNNIEYVPEEEYDQLDPFFDLLNATNRVTYKSIYVIDFHKKNFLYVSDNPLFLCGLLPQAVKEMGYSFYLSQVIEEDLDMLLEINRAGFEFFNLTQLADRKKISISYDFRIKCGKEKMINHKLTPIRLTENGNIWLAYCLVSLSSKKTSGNIEVHIEGKKDRWNYSLETHQWEKAGEINLTEREKKIILLSARGFTMNEIAAHLNIGIDTIKNAKRKLFKKLDVKNIAEAITAASNDKLI